MKYIVTLVVETELPMDQISSFIDSSVPFSTNGHGVEITGINVAVPNKEEQEDINSESVNDRV